MLRLVIITVLFCLISINKVQSMEQIESTELHKQQLEKQSIDGHSVISLVTDTLTLWVEETSKMTIHGINSLIHFPGQVKEALSHLKNLEVRGEFFRILQISLFVLGLAMVLEHASRWLIDTIHPLRFFHKVNERSKGGKFFIRLFAQALPLAIFALSAFVTTSFLIIEGTEHLLFQWSITPQMADEIMYLIFMIFIIRAIQILFKFICEPRRPHYRQVKISDATAKHLMRSVNQITNLITFGVAFSFLGLVLHLDLEAQLVWKRLMGLGVMILGLNLVQDYSEEVTEWLGKGERALKETSSFTLLVLSILAEVWHFIASFLIIVVYFIWAFGSNSQLCFILNGILMSTASIIGLNLVNDALATLSVYFKQHGLKKESINITDALAHSTFSLFPAIHIALYVFAFWINVNAWGIDLDKILRDAEVQDYILQVFSILLILGLSRALWSAVNIVAENQLAVISKTLFAETITPILRTFAHIAIVVIAVIMILSELNYEVTPILFGFSMFGLAFSFGAQSLVKDLITGALTLLEGNIAVGEQVVIGGNEGVVEKMTLRTIYLRHLSGDLQTIPYSEVPSIINKSRDFQSVDLVIPFGYAANLDEIRKLFQVVAKYLLDLPKYHDNVLADLSIRGVDRFTSDGFVFLAIAKVRPGLERHYRRDFLSRMGDELRKANIPVPSQHFVYEKGAVV